MEPDPNLSRRNNDPTTQQYPQSPEDEAADHLESRLGERSRGGFVKKVYGIVGTQLMATALWLFAVTQSQGLNQFVRRHDGLSMFAGIIAIIGMLGLGLSDRLSRTVPLNYALLGVTTLAQTYASSLTVSYFPSNVVGQAALATAAAVGGITYTGMTRRSQNWNTARAMMRVGFWVAVVQLLSYFFLRPNAQHVLVTTLAAIVAGVSLLYHTESVVGNKDKKYSKDDYIRASMNIYLEILQMFLDLLRLLNKLQGKNDEESSKKKKKEES